MHLDENIRLDIVNQINRNCLMGLDTYVNGWKLCMKNHKITALSYSPYCMKAKIYKNVSDGKGLFYECVDLRNLYQLVELEDKEYIVFFIIDRLQLPFEEISYLDVYKSFMEYKNSFGPDAVFVLILHNFETLINEFNFNIPFDMIYLDSTREICDCFNYPLAHLSVFLAPELQSIKNSFKYYDEQLDFLFVAPDTDLSYFHVDKGYSNIISYHDEDKYFLSYLYLDSSTDKLLHEISYRILYELFDSL